MMRSIVQMVSMAASWDLERTPHPEWNDVASVYELVTDEDGSAMVNKIKKMIPWRRVSAKQFILTDYCRQRCLPYSSYPGSSNEAFRTLFVLPGRLYAITDRLE